MNKVFLIPGLGADSRLYKNVVIPQAYDVYKVEWQEPRPASTLADYAQLLINEYNICDGAIVVGNSLGGVIAVEIAKKVALSKVILVSSIKTDSEAPWYFKFFRSVPIYKVIPMSLLDKGGFMIRPLFGDMPASDMQLFKSMLSNSSPIFMRWAMHAILQWRNNIVPPNLYHIVGDRDLIFPVQNIKHPTAVIKGGTHIMMFDRADEINKRLADILNANEVTC